MSFIPALSDNRARTHTLHTAGGMVVDGGTANGGGGGSLLASGAQDSEIRHIHDDIFGVDAEADRRLNDPACLAEVQVNTAPPRLAVTL
eukprot:COSAG05_NODE_5693_length_1114_cov_1.361576_1_plen_89_part_00